MQAYSFSHIVFKSELMAYKIILLLLLIHVLVGASNKPSVPPPIIKWAVEKNSTLRVQGKTNVNKFTCNIKQYAEKDTIICLGDASKAIRLTGELKMDVLSFNCHSKMITNDFRKTIKADKYPMLIIRFLSLETMPILGNNTEAIKGWVEVELAGVVKKFQLIYSFAKGPSNQIQLEGGRNFSFSDFKLTPPKKLGGMIKIKDAFDVNFMLTLQPV